MKRGGVVYILTNKTNSVIYIGVTSDLIKRMYEHLSGTFPYSFTHRYNINKLVYYQAYSSITEAIAEEKRLKAGSRKKKNLLVEQQNPTWEDLWIKEVSKW